MIQTDYLGHNEDWKKFCNNVSDNTGVMSGDKWLSNAKENRDLVKKYGWAAEDLQDAHVGKTAIILGASPAIRNQLDTLRKIQYDPDFILCSVSSGLKFLLENGITPKYNMIADADPAQIRFWEGMDMDKTKDITLISSVSVSRNMLDIWKGNMKFIVIHSALEGLEKKMEKWFHPINGCGIRYHALMSQYNSMASIAYLILRCEILIFVGNELSFSDKEVPYYVDKKDPKDKWERYPAPDIYGNVVYSNMMFMSLKLVLEDYLGKLPGWFFNCTEAGILGVSARHGNVPWIHQLTLTNGIAQARSIMRSGKPFYM